MNKLIVHTNNAQVLTIHFHIQFTKTCALIGVKYWIVRLNIELWVCNLLYRNCTMHVVDEQHISLATCTLKAGRKFSSKISTAMYPLTRCRVPKYLQIDRYNCQNFTVGPHPHSNIVPSAIALYQTDTGYGVSSKDTPQWTACKYR